MAAFAAHISTTPVWAQEKGQIMVIKHLHILILRHSLKNNLLSNGSQVQKRSGSRTVPGALMKAKR